MSFSKEEREGIIRWSLNPSKGITITTAQKLIKAGAKVHGLACVDKLKETVQKLHEETVAGKPDIYPASSFWAERIDRLLSDIKEILHLYETSVFPERNRE
jgi:hypothetical protein